MHLYLTHPEVAIDPAVPVPDWSLSARGRERAEALARSGRLGSYGRIVASAERKARDTAEILANALALPVETRPASHENDRSATGFLPPPEFQQVADAFFAQPRESVRGWERAMDAQARIVREVTAALADDDRPTLFVGHGGVGTLLLCHLAGARIARAHDQPGGGGGCLFSFAWTPPSLLTGWCTIEAFLADA